MNSRVAAATDASTPIIVVIPARQASTRLPGKMLADLGGKPMVVRVAEQALASKATRVVIATDHADIAHATRSAGIDTLMTRVDHASGTDRLAEAAAQLGLTAQTIVVNVQGDEPLIVLTGLTLTADTFTVDRIDSNKPYEAGNVAACHTTFNSLKSMIENPVNDLDLAKTLRGLQRTAKRIKENK